MSAKIPYVILEAYPDYKRPYISKDFGVIDENEKDTYFIEKAARFIFDMCDSETINNFNSVNDIDNFFNNYFDEYFMQNDPWSATIFINNSWESVIPTNAEIFECFNRLKTEYENDQENEEEEENDEEEDDQDEEKDINSELSDEETKIVILMREFIESELDKSDLEKMSKMNKTEQTIYVLTKCMLNISSDKYKENRELFNHFFTIQLKLIEKEIAVKTEEMKQNHDEKISSELSYLIDVYSSLLDYKTIYDNCPF
jgi:hypothetical protein